MKKYLAIALLGLSSLVTAQTVQTTPNQITSGTTHTWTGVTTGAYPTGCGNTTSGGACQGGPGPLYDPSTDTIHFSYGQGNVAQTFAINQALRNSGAGIVVQGYSYSWDIRNMNGDNRQNGTDTLTATVKTYAAGNENVRRTDTWTYSTKIDWSTFSGIVNYNNPGPINEFGNISVKFTGQDNGNWGGYFGPQVRNVSIGLRYTVDPCAGNPAYSPSCPGYDSVSISGNLLSGITGPQAYAINQALSFAGAGATIHGFDYGYDYRAAGRDCAIWSLLGICLSGWNYSEAGVTTTLTNSAGVVGYTETNTHAGGNDGVNGTYSKSLRLGSSVPMSTLGTFSMNPWTSGDASITNMYSRAVYTSDPCTVNPLSSTTCSGYTAARLTQQCSISALYDPSCPGYAQAVFSQQCNSNQLSNTACPGYAAAYLTQQCNINALYSTACSGYTSALNQCTVNPLGNTMCPSYQTASTECSANPLHGSYCPGHQTASQSCSSNALNASYCPGHQTALDTCSTNPLSNSMCSNYQSATVSCSSNSLNASYCPGYQAAQNTCSTNPLSNSLCSGYQFAKSCSMDGLYSRDCPNYSEAYAKKMLLEQQGLASTVATAGVVASTDPTKTSTPTTNSDGSVSVPVVSDTTVNNAITTKNTTVTSETAPAAPVKINPAPQPPTQSAQFAPKDDKKPEGKSDNINGPQGNMRSEDKPVDRPKTNRDQLAEQRHEVTKKEAVQKGKELSKEMGRMADMQAQMDVQNVVIQAMGYSPGFETYSRFILPDGQGYRPYTVYNNQRNVDSPAGRGLFGSSDVVHQQMVDSQYNLGN